MNEEEFMSLADKIDKYIKENKVFVQDLNRTREIKTATEIASQLFPNAKVYIADDPLQMGALILCIEDFDIVVRGVTEIDLFKSMVGKADNFEIYSIGDERVKVAILFNKVLRRIPNQ